MQRQVSASATSITDFSADDTVFRDAYTVEIIENGGKYHRYAGILACQDFCLISENANSLCSRSQSLEGSYCHFSHSVWYIYWHMMTVALHGNFRFPYSKPLFFRPYPSCQASKLFFHPGCGSTSLDWWPQNKSQLL